MVLDRVSDLVFSQENLLCCDEECVLILQGLEINEYDVWASRAARIYSWQCFCRCGNFGCTELLCALCQSLPLFAVRGVFCIFFSCWSAGGGAASSGGR